MGKEEKKKERTKESVRASSMPNDMVTAGNRAPQVEFFSSVLPVLCMCIIIFPWFMPSLMDCRVWSQAIAFGRALSLYSVSCTSLTKKTPAILKWSSTILTVTHIYIYMYTYMVQAYNPTPPSWSWIPAPPVGIGGLSPPPCGNGEGLLYGWMDGGMDGWMDGCLHACMHVCM